MSQTGRRRLCSPACLAPKIREGARLLHEVVNGLHVVETANQIRIESILSLETFDRLCMWQAQCENCEDIHEAEEVDNDLVGI